jgi:hypothetical protein
MANYDFHWVLVDQRARFKTSNLVWEKIFKRPTLKIGQQYCG